MHIDIVNREVRAGDLGDPPLRHRTEPPVPAREPGREASSPATEILDAIWGTDFVAESNIVDRHVRSLRIKLQNDYRHPRFIATVPGKGYRFVPTFTNTGWGGEEQATSEPGLPDRACRQSRPASDFPRRHDGPS